MITIKKICLIHLLLILAFIMGLTAFKTKDMHHIMKHDIALNLSGVIVPLRVDVTQNTINISEYNVAKKLYDYFDIQYFHHNEIMAQPHSKVIDENENEDIESVDDLLINQFYLLQNDLLQIM